MACARADSNDAVRDFLAKFIRNQKRNYRRAKTKKPIILGSADLALIVNKANKSRAFTAQRIAALLGERDDLEHAGHGRWKVIM
jgi:hypothetical protein